MNILHNIAIYLESKPEFKDLDFYYDESELSAKTELPCICFDVGYADDNSELHAIPKGCLTIYRKVGIQFYTRTWERGEMEDEVYTAEETLLQYLDNVLPQNIHENLVNIKYVGTNSLRSLFWHNLKQNEKEKFFANKITINYELEYQVL